MPTIATEDNKPKIPVPVPRQPVKPKKSEKPKSQRHQHGSSCSRKDQEELNFKKRNIRNQLSENAFTFQKLQIKIKKNNPVSIDKSSPSVNKLNQDLEKLKQQNVKDEVIIKKQNEEIAKLRKLVKLSMSKSLKRKQREKDIDQYAQVQIELHRELSEKCRLQDKLYLVTAENEKLNTQLIDLLEVKSQSIDNYTEKIAYLEKQLNVNELDFQKKVKDFEFLIQEKENSIKQKQLKKRQLIQHHQNHIGQLKQTHNDLIQTLRHQHVAKISICHQNTLNKKSKTSLDHLIEQVLIEFEQEQHNHRPNLPNKTVYPLKTGGFQGIPIVNQQWYSKKYMPIDAISWPTPQFVSDLKKDQTFFLV